MTASQAAIQPTSTVRAAPPYVPGHQLLAGKSVLITAAAGAGIGFAAARRAAEEGCRAVTLSDVLYPDGVDDMTFRKTLIEEGIICAGGLGAYAGKMFRLGHMGNIETNDIVAVLSTVERTLNRVGKLDKFGVAVTTYLSEIAK